MIGSIGDETSAGSINCQTARHEGHESSRASDGSIVAGCQGGMSTSKWVTDLASDQASKKGSKRGSNEVQKEVQKRVKRGSKKWSKKGSKRGPKRCPKMPFKRQ